MDQYWNLFYIIMGITAVAGIISAIFAKRIKEAMKKLEYFADGKVTAHHSYVPYD